MSRWGNVVPLVVLVEGRWTAGLFTVPTVHFVSNGPLGALQMFGATGSCLPNGSWHQKLDALDCVLGVSSRNVLLSFETDRRQTFSLILVCVLSATACWVRCHQAPGERIMLAKCVLASEARCSLLCPRHFILPSSPLVKGRWTGGLHIGLTVHTVSNGSLCTLPPGSSRLDGICQPSVGIGSLMLLVAFSAFHLVMFSSRVRQMDSRRPHRCPCVSFQQRPVRYAAIKFKATVFHWPNGK